jgi:uncharacterized protein (TIGR00730 family)
MSVERIAVFCGSKSGNSAVFVAQAHELGTMLALRGKTMVYGGGSVGMMGAVADAVVQGGGQVIGVITELLLTWEVQHTGISDLRVVPDMHVRKKMMYELSDAAIILPGGNGTLDELFEMLMLNNLKVNATKSSMNAATRKHNGRTQRQRQGQRQGQGQRQRQG